MMVQHEYQHLWGTHDTARSERARDFFIRTRSAHLEFMSHELETAFRKIKKKSRRDLHGVSVTALNLIFKSCPDEFSKWLSRVVCDSEGCQLLRVRGFVSGKSSGTPRADETRAILPQPAISQLCDCVLEQRIFTFISSQEVRHPAVFTGAVAGTQPLDAAATMQLAIEKMLDCKSEGAVAQCDVARYCDNLDLLAVAEDMIRHGLDCATARACLVMQYKPRVQLSLMFTACSVSERCAASLTGSRIAGAFARWPIQSTMNYIRPHLSKYAYECLDRDGVASTVCMFTWVDNLYCIARSQAAAAECMSLIEQFLSDVWNLRIKPSSRMYLLPHGALDQNCFDQAWNRTVEFLVLGHVLSPNAGIRCCWKSGQKPLWRAFWGNCKNKHLRNDQDKALRLLERSVHPVIAFRVSRWPPQKVISQELDGLQAKMIASIRRLRLAPGEEDSTFFRRRLKDARAIARKMGSWSGRWFKRFVQWNEHLDRHPSHPATRVMRTRDRIWLQNCRSIFAARNPVRWNSWTCLAGRTDTRIAGGYVAQRWENGLALALERV